MKKGLIILLVIWLGIYLASFVIPATYEPTGDGFTRGLNRVAAFFGWQIGAGLLGLFIWLLSRPHELSTFMRWLTRVPILLASALFLFVIGLILWANLSRPPPSDYVPPENGATTTEPAIPVQE